MGRPKGSKNLTPEERAAKPPAYGRTGRGRDWRKCIVKYSADELVELCERYFNECDENKTVYTKSDLILALNISEDTFNRWYSNENNEYSELSDVIKKALLVIRGQFERMSGRDTTKSIFLLKQPCYGGYSDSQGGAGDGTLNVVVKFGDDHDADKYGK